MADPPDRIFGSLRASTYFAFFKKGQREHIILCLTEHIHFFSKTMFLKKTIKMVRTFADRIGPETFARNRCLSHLPKNRSVLMIFCIFLADPRQRTSITIHPCSIIRVSPGFVLCPSTLDGMIVLTPGRGTLSPYVGRNGC